MIYYWTDAWQLFVKQIVSNVANQKTALVILILKLDWNTVNVFYSLKVDSARWKKIQISEILYAHKFDILILKKAEKSHSTPALYVIMDIEFKTWQDLKKLPFCIVYV